MSPPPSGGGVSTARLWAPWRQTYITRTQKGASSSCLFCAKGRSRADARNLVIARGPLAFTLLNLFPYNNGHLLIAPYRHVGTLGALTEEEWRDLFHQAEEGIHRLQRAMKPEGYNLGLNLGRAAGAGIPGHLHLHILPRWNGDTNFMPTLAQTKVISQSLRAAYRLLRGGRSSGAPAVRS